MIHTHDLAEGDLTRSNMTKSTAARGSEDLNSSGSRRSWLKQSFGAGLGLCGFQSAQRQSQGATVSTEGKTIKLALLADLHYGLAPDALERLDTFMGAVDAKKPDLMFQLGDFHYGVDAEPCIRLWDQFVGPKYHVLGNHDMDKVTKDRMVEVLGMPSAYYSFVFEGWHFIVVDRNHLRTPDGKYIDYAKANFYVDRELRGFADPEQLEWLKEELTKNELPTLVFSHQGLGMETAEKAGLQNSQLGAAAAIEAVLGDANRSGRRKVRACFCGHHHIDRYNKRDGIHYLWINSASYHWVGEAYGRMAAYRDPLFAFASLHADGSIDVEGRKTDWVAPTPEDREFPNHEQLNTLIANRSLS